MKIVSELFSPQEFKDKIEAQKKVNASMSITDINRMFSYIDYFNTLTEHETRIMGVNIEEIEVIDELKDFIIPTSVRYDASDLRTKDVLERPKRDDITFYTKEAKVKKELVDVENDDGKIVKEEKVIEVEAAVTISPNLTDFNNLQSNLRRLFKRDFKDGKTKLSDLKKRVSFEEIKSKAAFGNDVAFFDSPYVPVFLNSTIKGAFFESSYFNAKVNELMAYYKQDYLF